MNPEIKIKDGGALHRTIYLEGGPNQRYEVEVSEDGRGRSDLTLRELSWGTGVGWFVQKSIRLEAPQVESLRKALCCLRPQPARCGCRLEQSGEARNVVPSGEILKFDPKKAS